jgi:predicted RNA-binding protein with PUA-like domain
MTGYWLMKSEPSVFSFADLKKAPKKTTSWEGVRNYQARNLLRDDVAVGDGVLFYHSSTDPQAIMGTAVVVRAAYPDPTQFDRKSKYYDEGAKRDDPRWYMVDIRFERQFATPLTLQALRKMKGLEAMGLLKRGNRLSVQPVTANEWEIIVKRGLLAADDAPIE